MNPELLNNIDQKRYGFKDPQTFVYKTAPGLNPGVVKTIVTRHQEPDWLLKSRLSALKIFKQKPMPTWGADLSKINFDKITYYWQPTKKSTNTWKKVPKKIKQTFDRLGIPQAERKFLAGVGAQYESEIIYHNLKKEWTKLGVVFCDMSEAPRLYPELMKKYFGTVVPADDNKFAALNTAVWSGGSFIYVPKGVKVSQPLQAYFRINAPAIGQFERTLIIVDEGAQVHYIEGCTAPMYSKDSLHAAVVEIVALKNARVRYTTIQNWSNNVYNLVTKRALAYQNAVVEWVDGNLGSQVTMKYPSVVLKEPGAVADILSIAFAGKGQHQDAGAKAIHLAPYTSSKIIAKSIAKDGGRTSYRGLIRVGRLAHHCRVKVNCDALLLDQTARTDTYPTMKIQNHQTHIEHEAAVSKISEDQLLYLQSRGLTRPEAERMIVAGFLEIFTRELPLEYAVELSRLIELEMDGSVG
ncbi:MAG: Fe-S cluster assembly protein SufB [Candidatus Buchananbacteria bacterium RIFCSPLOWO2_01_FULL_46_12]|uniref:Fe-S cluster assembly protein SufB n=1 Tax=Candidatus Buchananbacteria bacterium RIFCSPLOWO2_01_FULL_46_12 TaxID=1797546 RepID=A0A1G1YSV0_9BACT|nr:MAG: Fe-S cluster assembly protein SufB [Candidatus Buchananbacteria bacterium RIFCSPLOWO2_01_FULL_46_12]